VILSEIEFRVVGIIGEDRSETFDGLLEDYAPWARVDQALEACENQRALGGS
jgi:hypothetical protein